MASGWHKLARVFHADWKEIRTRGGQEVHKRADLARYRMGWSAGASQISLEQGTGASFFFTPAEARERARLIQTHLPNQAEAIVREADDICCHRFRLLGYEDLDYGATIDWHLDRVHGKRAPLDPWFKIPFLVFDAVGDHKITWELNRHQHLVTLAKAWLLTGDDKHVREIIAQWQSWTEANPYPLGINWGSSLEVAFRSLSWIWVDHLLAESTQYAQFRSQVLSSLAFQGRYVERYLSTYFSPNTHLLGEALALFFIGTLYPQMPRAQRWRNEGWKILVNEAGRQVRPDGVYFEQSLYYHVYTLDFYLHARLLAARNGIAVPAALDDTVRKMLDVVEALAEAGPAEGFGDDDGGRLFNPRRNQTEHMTDPLALGALVFDREFRSAKPTEEAIWLFGQQAVAGCVARAPSPALPVSAVRSIAFPDGGLYIAASAAPFPQTMVIDAGPFGTGRCGHGHADALSIRLAMKGKRWLVDSGSGVYMSSDSAERNNFRGTAAHNTLRVDGADQAIPDEPFSWTGIPTTRVENWVTGKTFTYFAGCHNGYERLPSPVTHERHVLSIDGGICVVRDVALGRGEHNLELNWHFAGGLTLGEAGPSAFIAYRPEEKASLRMILPEQTDWNATIADGQLAPAYGRFEKAPLLRCSVRLKAPAETATVLLAENAQRTPNLVRADSSLSSSPHEAVQIYQLRHEGHAFAFFFARDKQPWATGPWSSDAEVLVCSTKNEKLEQLVVIGGSSVAWQGGALFDSSQPFRFFEWRRHDGIVASSPDSFSTTPSFDELISGLHGPSLGLHPTSTYAEKH
ncbi:MAG TPA: alginate lyase family protein [Terriglobales bacterium]|nr:alginate lyase family protein [Terriglobales bacterium]